MAVIPRIVSVDDHVIEPADVWQDRLPAKYRDIGPRVIQEAGNMDFVGGNFTYEPDPDGQLCDWWIYEDARVPQTRLSAAAGFDRDEVKVVGITYEEMRDGCYDPTARLADMDMNHVEASLCFPSFPRFCGQTFMEAEDKVLAKLCVEAYNDWMVDEWCGGTDGRLIPLCIIPLWDAQLAAAEIHRNAARGVRAVCFSEIPPYLGLPSVHDADGYWEPFVRACEETGTVINMHIGSSSRMPATSPDAPVAVAASLSFNNAMASMSDWLFSGNLVKFPDLKLAYSEGQIGWIPYILERVDDVWREHRAWGGVKDLIPEPPSTYYYKNIYGCFFRDQHGVDSLDIVGVDNITFETDYPHTDSTWPNTLEVATGLMEGVPDEAVYKIMRGNAIRMLHLDLDRDRQPVGASA